MIRLKSRCFLLITCLFAINFAFAQTSDWRNDWSVPPSFAVEIDSSGYNFPTSIAFVPNPGNGPKDPLYFVTELRGKVKVVTNDRTVHVFAEDFFRALPDMELPSATAEFGMAGICLDPKHGYVFVTFSYQNPEKLLFNRMIRFSTAPETFSTRPKEMLDIAEPFAGEEAAVSHQIGNCEIVGDALYVSVGDAQKTYPSQRLDSVLGKVLRMTLEGKPFPDNPFYEDNETKKPQNYIFAYGLRNPFAIQNLGTEIFVADNGYKIDRLLEVEKGENYLWNGKDLSIGTNAITVFSPAVAPVQMDYYPGGSFLPEKYDRSFFLAASGWVTIKGPSPGKGVLTFPYDPNRRRLLNVPEYIVQYTGSDYQGVVGVAVGKNGLYFVPLYPVYADTSAVLKLIHKPGYSHSNLIGLSDKPEVIMMEKGCLSCHSFKKEKDMVGPSLDAASLIPRIQARLTSEGYQKSIEELDRISKEPYHKYKDARNAVLQSGGLEQVRIWLKYHLLEPKFDNPNSQMPNTGLTEQQAVNLASYLTREKADGKKKKEKKAASGKDKAVAYIYFGGGTLAGLLIAAVGGFLWSRRRLKQTNRFD